MCDLPGEKVAINSLLGLGQLFVDANYYNAHCKGDPDTGWKRIKFVAILFPQMATALQKGEVDAIWTLEPFLSSEPQLKVAAGRFRVPDRAARADHGDRHVLVVCEFEPAMFFRCSPRWSNRTCIWPPSFGDADTDRQVHDDSEEPDPE